MLLLLLLRKKEKTIGAHGKHVFAKFGADLPLQCVYSERWGLGLPFWEYNERTGSVRSVCCLIGRKDTEYDESA